MDFVRGRPWLYLQVSWVVIVMIGNYEYEVERLIGLGLRQGGVLFLRTGVSSALVGLLIFSSFADGFGVGCGW